VNVNEQRIIAFLTENCCYLNLRSKVCTQLRYVVNFTTFAWLRLAKVIVKNKMSRFLWFIVYFRKRGLQV